MYVPVTMSATPAPDVTKTIDRCQPEDLTPIRIDARTLETTAPEYLRDLKHGLTTEGFVPAGLSVEACFEEDCSLAIQDELERVRSHIRVAAFLGVGTMTVSLDDVADPDAVGSGLEACAERAAREGVTLRVDGPVTVSA